MGTLIPTLLACLFSSVAFGQAYTFRDQPFMGNAVPVAGVSGPTNIICSVWETFEFAGPVDATKLAANDGTNTVGTWTIQGVASTNLGTSTEAELHTLGKPQNTADTGTTGLVITNVTVAAGSAAYVRYAFPAAVDNVSAGVWFYAIPFSSTTTLGLFSLLDGSGNLGIRTEYRSPSLNTYAFRFNTSSQNSSITITTTNAWYWITQKFSKSGTCSMAVFDSSGAQVGTTQTFTDASGLQISRCQLGHPSSSSTVTAVNLWLDDLLIDYTLAQFPLGP